MKKIVVGSVIAMAAGAGMMAYALNNKNTKRKLYIPIKTRKKRHQRTGQANS